jgi:hypothetical protein
MRHRCESDESPRIALFELFPVGTHKALNASVPAEGRGEEIGRLPRFARNDILARLSDLRRKTRARRDAEGVLTPLLPYEMIVTKRVMFYRFGLPERAVPCRPLSTSTVAAEGASERPWPKMRSCRPTCCKSPGSCSPVGRRVG